MKTIGLIGGMSWESSLEYYRLINETAKARLGGQERVPPRQAPQIGLQT